MKVVVDRVRCIYCCCVGSGECGVKLSDFLDSRNPRQDHSISLPALFAKPIVVR